MKTNLIIAFFLLSIIFTRCRKHECNALSWTDYNTVEDVWCNFYYNMDEYKQHIDDTLKVYGWLFKNPESYKEWQYLTSNKDIQFCENMSILFNYPFVTLNMGGNYFQFIPENPYDSALYITGTIWYDQDVDECYLFVTNVKK